jgi:hypothetical protein
VATKVIPDIEQEGCVMPFTIVSQSGTLYSPPTETKRDNVGETIKTKRWIWHCIGCVLDCSRRRKCAWKFSLLLLSLIVVGKSGVRTLLTSRLGDYTRLTNQPLADQKPTMPLTDIVQWPVRGLKQTEMYRHGPVEENSPDEVTWI